jgi:hypothetical protein
MVDHAFARERAIATYKAGIVSDLLSNIMS